MNSRITFVVLFFLTTNIFSENRTWTNTSGGKFEGELVESNAEEAIILRSSDRQVFKVPLTKLSEEDLTYIDSLRKETVFSELEIDALKIQREELIAAAEAEKEMSIGKGRKLGQAAVILLEIDEEQAREEISKIVKKYGKLQSSQVGANILIGAARYYEKKSKFGDDDAWPIAMAYYLEIIKDYKGLFKNHACNAAKSVAKHYETEGDNLSALKYQKIVVEHGGSHWFRGGDACLWIADYHIAQNQKAKALIYLNMAVTKCNKKVKGRGAKIISAAESRIAEIKNETE